MSTLDPRRLQRHLRESLRRHAPASRAGPFTCYLHPESRDPSLNVAIPDEPTEGRRVPVMGDEAAGHAAVPEDDAELGAVMLKAHFVGNGRTPRVEFLDACHPELADVLARHGFREDPRTPLLACTRATWRQLDPPEGARIEPLLPGSPWDVARRYLEVQREAFELDMDVPENGPKGYWPAMQLGAGLLATIDGEPAAAGGITPALDGLADVRGLAVRPEFRRRGLGAFLLSALGHIALETGIEALVAVPESDAETELARRAGFEPLAAIRSFRAADAAAR